LIQEGFAIRIYGPKLPPHVKKFLDLDQNVNAYITYEEKSKVFSSALGVLNNFHPSHKNAVNCRVFEVLASGGLLISEHSELLEQSVAVDSYLSYKTYDELVSIMRRIVECPKSFIKIRENALIESQNHTLLIRAKVILSEFTTIRLSQKVDGHSSFTSDN
jgi:spore maturation protein CgeB